MSSAQAKERPPFSVSHICQRKIHILTLDTGVHRCRSGNGYPRRGSCFRVAHDRRKPQAPPESLMVYVDAGKTEQRLYTG